MIAPFMFPPAPTAVNPETYMAAQPKPIIVIIPPPPPVVVIR